MQLLKNRLKINQSQSPYKLPIAFIHHPVYSQQDFYSSSPKASPFKISKNIYQSKNMNFYCPNRKETRDNVRMRELERGNSGKSVTERNSLFKRLALKMEQQNKLKFNQRKQVINEYYDVPRQKQNDLNSCNRISKLHQSKLKIDKNKESLTKKHRYEAKLNIQISSSISKVKFNKIGAKKKKSITQECDIVRTSQGSYLTLKDGVRQSLDMRPII